MGNVNAPVADTIATPYMGRSSHADFIPVGVSRKAAKKNGEYGEWLVENG
jgi:hypothetical protein